MILETVVVDWVSLKRALPPPKTNVIITDEVNITVGSWDFLYDKVTWKCYEPYVFNPTQWMPLPEIKKINF